MKVTRLSEQAFHEAFGIKMAAIDAFPGEADRETGVGYGVIEPSHQSALHLHDECEVFVIVTGTGTIVADGGTCIAVNPGDVVTVEPFDKHVIRNTGSERLIFADLYWRDSVRAANGSSPNRSDAFANRSIFVFSTPPTPNGDLHLGHLSGPYLGADVFTRYQRMLGNDAYHITGSDDFQSYVIAKARQLGSDPQAVATRFCEEIMQTLAMMDIDVHQFTITSQADGYDAGLKDFFDRLTASGGVVRSGEPAAFDTTSGAYLYECDITGQCPSCGVTCGGNICEECGEPNLAFNLCNPVSTLSGEAPVIGELERHTLSLKDYMRPVLDGLRAGKAAPRLHSLAEKVFARKSLRFPITHPQTWGISPNEPAGPGQVVWVWPEMAYGFLYGVEALGKRNGREWKALMPQNDWKIVHFFGYDNSFYHTILYPTLYHLAYPKWSPDIDYHVNEFYLLEGRKFSTSRQHAVWGKEVLTPSSVDGVRYHLCLTRGEIERTDFDRGALARTHDDILAHWDEWLGELGGRIERVYSGVAPDAGDWSADHRAFLALLECRRGNLECALSPEGFSLNRAAAELNGLVQDARRFAASHRHTDRSELMADRNRTTTALQLAAAILLSDAATPLMPRFSRSLRLALGLLDDRVWPDHVQLLAPGTDVALAGHHFFHAMAVESVTSVSLKAAE